MNRKKKIKNYFNYNEWEMESYDQLLIHIYHNFKIDELRSIIKKEISNLQYISKKQLLSILKRIGDMSIFQSKLDIKILKEHIYCQLVSLENLKDSLQQSVKRREKTQLSEDMLEELLNIFLLSETLKIHTNKKYRIILERNYN